MPQTTYLQAEARNGMVADATPVAIDSYTAAADLPIGTAVARASDDVVQAPSGAVATDIPGVLILNMDCNYYEADDVAPAESTLSVLRQGVVWVNVEDAVTQGAAVYFRHNAPGSETLGAFRSDTDGGDATLLPGAVFRTSTAAAGLAQVAINLP